MKEMTSLNFKQRRTAKDREFPYGRAAEKRAAAITFEETIEQARQLKEFLGVDWKYLPGKFPQPFENYTAGWNAPASVLKDADETGKLLFLNIDLEDNGCTRACPHCYTMEGQIDADRGRHLPATKSKLKTLPTYNDRKQLPKERLVEQIAEATSLGLRSVRILGRGEPTESPYLLDFVDAMDSLGVQTLIFTRGHVIGNDMHTELVYGGRGIATGVDLAKYLFDKNASIILGYSALDDVVHDGMVGIDGHAAEAREGLKRLITLGYHESHPTRVGIEAPVCKLNVREMKVAYALFQSLGISPVFNSYMVTGRTDENLFTRFTPALEERLDSHAQITHSMEALGITADIGAYQGTKACHDVEHGLYIPSTGEVRPCPGYQSRESIKGDIATESIVNIWQKSRPGREQHVCEPKVAHGFPLNYVKLAEKMLGKDREHYAQVHDRIIDGLGLKE